MCMQIKNTGYTGSRQMTLEKIVRMSDKNITVYKVFVMLELPKMVSGRVVIRTVPRTPFMNIIVDPDGDMMIEENFILSYNYIYQGIHAYTKRQAADKLKRVLTGRTYTKYRVIPCVIPAHTPYIIGTNGQIVTLILADFVRSMRQVYNTL